MNQPRRKSIRLKGDDYSQAGFYFITICTQNQLCLFGEIQLNGEMKPNSAGCMIEKWWLELSRKFPTVTLHERIVMPNHFHGILQIDHTSEVNDRAKEFTPVKITDQIEQLHISPTSLASIIGWFKSMTMNEYIRQVKSQGWPPFHQRLWQRNYYEHIIQDEDAWQEISDYIRTNPQRWIDDKYYRYEK
ncbi:transposase [uncultured Gimesia sp.]|uniref:transposase n=1 Tax=uncultured Gimesia sp. TaxID=1678688 RepID=UPI0030DCE324|tara:strand:- start:3660 stop:4226 length:567 start_codon:yes stop_codon:yes gene_type:complete